MFFCNQKTIIRTFVYKSLIALLTRVVNLLDINKKYSLNNKKYSTYFSTSFYKRRSFSFSVNIYIICPDSCVTLQSQQDEVCFFVDQCLKVNFLTQEEVEQIKRSLLKVVIQNIVLSHSSSDGAGMSASVL